MYPIGITCYKVQGSTGRKNQFLSLNIKISFLWIILFFKEIIALGKKQCFRKQQKKEYLREKTLTA